MTLCSSPADTVGDFVYTYDANGNVGQLIDGTPTSWDAGTVMVARYEYDPYGKVTQSAGSYAAANPFRFSTKWFDAETGFGYWGERYDWPELGRWLNRDPIEEAGGVNLYAYAMNAPTYLWDVGGLCVLSSADTTCAKEGNTCEDEIPPGFGKWPGIGEDVPPPGIDEWPRWDRRKRQPAPWGTCKKTSCRERCGQSTAKGLQACEDGEPCYCICSNRIYPEGWERRPGRAKFGEIAERCAVAHEKVHLDNVQCEGDQIVRPPDGGYEECKADMAGLLCVEVHMDECAELRRGKCDCLNRLSGYVGVKGTEGWNPCVPDEKLGEPACPEKNAADCKSVLDRVRKKLRALREKHGCLNKGS